MTTNQLESGYRAHFVGDGAHFISEPFANETDAVWELDQFRAQYISDGRPVSDIEVCGVVLDMGEMP